MAANGPVSWGLQDQQQQKSLWRQVSKQDQPTAQQKQLFKYTV